MTLFTTAKKLQKLKWFLWREWCWSWNSSTLATSGKELTHCKRLWCWEGLGAGGEGDDQGWDGWMASLTRWMWVWVNSGSWWWTGRPGVLRFMGSQRVGHDWVAELDFKEIQPVHSEGDQPCDFFGRNDAKAATPILWPPHEKSWLTGEDPDAGRHWGQEEKGTTEDEMAGWHHRLDAHESEWTPGVGDGQGGLVCCNSWGHKGLDTTEWLNWTELNLTWGQNESWVNFRKQKSYRAYF